MTPTTKQKRLCCVTIGSISPFEIDFGGQRAEGRECSECLDPAGSNEQSETGF
jgi:hypothetical protein